LSWIACIVSKQIRRVVSGHDENGKARVIRGSGAVRRRQRAIAPYLLEARKMWGKITDNA
jgi:hypothetical protein